jgi:putative flippase GtrA
VNSPPSSRRRVVRFAAVGVASTGLYLIIYVVTRLALGAQASNLIALLLSAMANTVLNKRLTFEVGGRTSARTHVQGLLVFALGAALTSGALSILHALVHDPGRVLEVAVLLAATAVATVVRFFLFSRWIFRHSAAGSGVDGAGAGSSLSQTQPPTL